MTPHTIYILLSACFGFAAAVFFAIGTAFINKDKIVAIASTYWNYNKEQAHAKVSQSAQYLIGSLFLVVSFFLQVVANLATPTNNIEIHSVLVEQLAFVLSTLVAIFLISWPLYSLLIWLRLPEVEKELKKEENNGS
jgi:hypothetical protein